MRIVAAARQLGRGEAPETEDEQEARGVGHAERHKHGRPPARRWSGGRASAAKPAHILRSRGPNAASLRVMRGMIPRNPRKNGGPADRRATCIRPGHRDAPVYDRRYQNG
jgi:hypothetical protein